MRGRLAVVRTCAGRGDVVASESGSLGAGRAQSDGGAGPCDRRARWQTAVGVGECGLREEMRQALQSGTCTSMPRGGSRARAGGGEVVWCAAKGVTQEGVGARRLAGQLALAVPCPLCGGFHSSGPAEFASDHPAECLRLQAVCANAFSHFNANNNDAIGEHRHIRLSS